MDQGVVKRGRYYGPKEKITRAEFMKVIVGAMRMQPDPCIRSTFGDVDLAAGDLCGYVMTGVRTGIIIRNPFFRPEDIITRGEAFKIIYRAMVVMGRYPVSASAPLAGGSGGRERF